MGRWEELEEREEDIIQESKKVSPLGKSGRIAHALFSMALCFSLAPPGIGI